MGAGKSTLGRALQSSPVSSCEPSLPGCRFIDLDDEIEARAGMRITEIFATRGEEVFRQLEADTLQAVTDGARGRDGLTVVATGGIAPVIAPACRHEMHMAADLILRGLAVLYEQNK